jgi:glc operon protein GlcG
MLRITLFAAAILCRVSLFAQTTPPQPNAKPVIIPYGDPITLELAHQIVGAAVKEANANGWTMAIAIVDCGGNLVMFEKMDNTQVGSVDVAIGKAKTANNFKRPTKAMEDAVAGGGIGLRMLALPGVFPLEGGEPITVNGRIIGAIGVSGMQSTQDGQVVKVALSALKK